MESFDAKNIGLIIKKYRKAAKYTQAELAEKIDLNDKQLGKVERGIHYPSLPTFLKIIKELKIDINEFYGDGQAFRQNSELLFLINNFSPEQLELARKILKVI